MKSRWEVSLSSIEGKSKLIVIKPVIVHAPFNAIAQSLLDFKLVVICNLYTLPYLLLNTKAKAPLAVLYPKPVDNAEVLPGKPLNLSSV